MSQGGDDAALLIANADDQYQDALLADFNDPLDTIYTALLVDMDDDQTAACPYKSASPAAESI